LARRIQDRGSGLHARQSTPPPSRSRADTPTHQMQVLFMAAISIS
jgi:hypothetical protein